MYVSCAKSVVKHVSHRRSSYTIDILHLCTRDWQQITHKKYSSFNLVNVFRVPPEKYPAKCHIKHEGVKEALYEALQYFNFSRSQHNNRRV